MRLKDYYWDELTEQEIDEFEQWLDSQEGEQK